MIIKVQCTLSGGSKIVFVFGGGFCFSVVNNLKRAGPNYFSPALMTRLYD